MKKLVCIIAAVCLFSPQNASSQEQEERPTSRDAKRRVVPGFKFGFTRSNVYDRDGRAFVSEGKTGWGAGASVALPLGSLLGIQPELLFLQKGFEGAGIIAGEHYIINRSTTHVDIPIQLQIKPFSWFTFLVGPQWSFLISRRDSYTAGSNTLAQKRIEAIHSRENLFGTSVGFDVNFGHVVLAMRSGWDVTANHNDGSSETPRYRNRWLFWAVGYRFY